MKRFGGKFSFVIDNRKLIFWENRLGLITQTRTEVQDKNGRMVPLPPEATEFFAIDQGDGTFLLQCCNGEIMCVNPASNIVMASTLPTRVPFFLIPMPALRFDLSELRKFKTDISGVRLRAYRESDPKNWFDLTYRRAVEREMDRGFGARHLSNLDNTTRTTDLWFVRQLADGVDELKATKKAAYRNYSPSGQAIVDLSGEDLTGVEFADADFTRAVLTGTVLKNTTYTGASFSHAQLDGANLEGATLHTVNFSDASMRGTTLSGVKGASCNFSRCDLLTVVSTAPLALESPQGGTPTRFSYAHLNYALIGPNWVRKQLDWATVRSFPPDPVIDAQNANLTGLTLNGVKIGAGSKFDGATLRGASLHASTLAYCSFKGAFLDATKQPEFAACDLAAAQLQGSVFDDTHCTGANFSGARLDEATFEKATLIGANFANAYLREVSFAAVEQQGMRGAIFNRAFLVNAKFNGADLSTYDGTAVNLTQAYLHGADFTGAKLSGTLLTGAGLSFAAGEIEVKLGEFTITVEYDKATEIDPRTTTRETTCPSGAKGPGPCSAEDMHTLQPFPAVWPWPHGRRKELVDDED